MWIIAVDIMMILWSMFAPELFYQELANGRTIETKVCVQALGDQCGK